MSELTENIKVFVRVRPSTSFEKIVQVLSDREIALISNAACESKYKFNAIFSEYIHQDEAYNVILVPIIHDFIQGYNCTLFLYGTNRNDATNAASTNMSLFSSTPNALSSIPSIPKSPDDAMTGLISCAMYRLFEHLTQLELSSSIRISYLEIHDEELFDLLQPNSAASTQLKIFENDKNQVYVNGLTETTVHSAAEAIMIFQMAQKNIHSLKSHSIFMISMQTQEIPKFQMQENEGLFKFRKLCLVQLGSQECQRKQARAKTVQSITSLSRVVQALTNKQNHIPYRDSKLTRIMQESLGGNAKTAIVASIGSSSKCIEETVQALEFLNRIKCICNHPKVNERLDDLRTLNEMALEIRKLIMDIEANRNKTGHFLTDEMYVNYQNEMETTRNHARRHKHELMLVNDKRVDLDCTFSNVNSSLCSKNEELAKLQSETSTKQKQLQTISKVNETRQILIEKHAIKEKTVTEQANEITNTVGMVLVDKAKLDDCVKRYKLIDDQLLQAVEGFQIDMQTKMTDLRRNSTIVLQLIDTKLQKTGDLEKHFLRSASSLLEIMKKKSFLILSQLDENRTKEGNKWMDMKSEFDEIFKKPLKSIDLNITIYKEYGRKFEEQSNTIEASYQEIRDLYENHFIAEDQLIAEIKQRMKSHSVEISDQIKSLCLTVEECVEIGKIIDEKMNSIYNEMREIVAQIQQNTSEIKNIVEPTLQATEKNMQQTRQAIYQSIEAYGIEINRQKDIFIQPKVPEDFKANQFELKNIVQRKLMITDDTIHKVAMNNMDSMKYNLGLVQTLSEDIPSKRDIIDSDRGIQTLKDKLSSQRTRSTKQNDENVALINDIISDTERMWKNNADEIQSCVQQLKYFRDLDFCEYEPTGETPAKRDFSTNFSLATTTPLEKIKQRFRDRLSSQMNEASSNLEFSFLND